MTRQARRLQELHRILTRSGFVWDECSSVPLLKAICDARGFGCSLVGGPVLIQDELSAESLQVTLQLTCDFATTSAKRETSLRQERFAEALKHSIRAQGGKHAHQVMRRQDQPEVTSVCVHAPLRWRHLRRRVKGSGFRFCRAFTPP